MFKKFIIAFTLSLICIGFINVKADEITYTDCFMLYRTNNIYYKYEIGSDALNNTDTFTYENYQFVKPVIIRVPNSTWHRYYIVFKGHIHYIYHENNYESPATTTSIVNFSDRQYDTYGLYSIPMFDDFENASLYSRGQDFDASHLLGGYNPPTIYDDTTKYAINVLNFDNALLPIKSGRFLNNFAFYFQWEEIPTVPTDCHHVFNFNISFLDSETLDTIYYGYGNDGLSWESLISVLEIIKDGGVNAILDYPNNYVTKNFLFDLETTLSNGQMENWITYNIEESSPYNKHSILWKEADISGPFGFDANPTGILNYLTTYYGDAKKACFALAYVNFNYIDAYVYKITSTKRIVYDWFNTYYIDLRKSNGTVAQHRSFKTETPIDDEYIDTTTTPDVIGDTPTDIPKLDIPDNVRNSTYNQSIQDSYNNIVNNYYYDNGLTDNILNYYRGFSDGATDENIDSALGYVKSTLGSLTHIPLLLGYCFTGFFPPEILMLFYALLIIFIVFMIIRIIKHLFTH